MLSWVRTGVRNKLWRLWIVALFSLGMAGPDAVWANDEMSWLVYYSDKAPVGAFKNHSLLVLDSRYHPPLRPLADRGKTLLGYLSLGEVASDADWYEEMRQQGILGAENPAWPGSFYVDLRDPRWVKRVVEELVPSIVKRGFQGVFLDTLDNAGHLERLDPKKYHGMVEAGARLVRTIRRHYPYLVIMINRGYELVPLVGDQIDMLTGESVYARHDASSSGYARVVEKDYLWQVKQLKKAKKRHPRLKIFSLDYWNPDDAAGLREIYRIQRQNGFSPYVSVPKLDRIVIEPKEGSR
ncbi:MAG: endo alpha-1,4 polygalactosaminidase [Magnetococcales bacterium]|nr:endo alpha-1,4 polygalactosaminidase [Magnetococcales bacterium]